jgi:hypothetical protein
MARFVPCMYRFGGAIECSCRQVIRRDVAGPRVYLTLSGTVLDECGDPIKDVHCVFAYIHAVGVHIHAVGGVCIRPCWVLPIT